MDRRADPIEVVDVAFVGHFVTLSQGKVTFPAKSLASLPDTFFSAPITYDRLTSRHLSTGVRLAKGFLRF